MAIKMNMSLRSSVRPSVLSKRPSVVVRQGKGGEEGGKSFDKSCYGTLATNANYALLASALAKTGLDKVLMGEGPFTLFAPNDDAFADAARALKISKIELMALPNLGDILKYHVISGKVMSTDLTEGMQAPTVNGKALSISLKGGVTVNGKKVKKADVKTSNGVIHAIDAVLIP